MSWVCKQCENEVDDDFEICWSCGATVEGEKDPDFFPEIEATDLPADGSRFIVCDNCDYRGKSQRVRATKGSAYGLISFVFGSCWFSNLTNHGCPRCGETRRLYDWKK